MTEQQDFRVAACFQKAVELLSFRPHFRRELERKLGRRGFEAEAVDEALDRLQDRGYLDDLGCARGWAAGSLQRKGFGPQRMRAELKRRGAPGEVVEVVIAERFPDGDLEPALEAAKRWRARGGDGRAALARHLSRKGFSEHAIVEALSTSGESEGPA